MIQIDKTDDGIDALQMADDETGWNGRLRRIAINYPENGYLDVLDVWISGVSGVFG